jgi:hypothetical protein
VRLGAIIGIILLYCNRSRGRCGVAKIVLI